MAHMRENILILPSLLFCSYNLNCNLNLNPRVLYSSSAYSASLKLLGKKSSSYSNLGSPTCLASSGSILLVSSSSWSEKSYSPNSDAAYEAGPIVPVN